jgi:hypothetical protein
VLITTGPLRLISETFIQLGIAVPAGTCALIEALALLIIIFSASRKKANENQHQQNQRIFHYLLPFDILSNNQGFLPGQSTHRQNHFARPVITQSSAFYISSSLKIKLNNT